MTNNDHHHHHLYYTALWLLLCHVVQWANAQDQMCQNSNKKHLVPHEKFCDFFYRCEDGRAVLEECPHGLAFAGYRRGMLGHCGYPHEVGCPDGIRVMGQVPRETGNCPWDFGTFAHETSCTRYWQCWNGTSSLQNCPYSLLYNEQIHSCDWPNNVPDCQKHPICKDTPNGAVAIQDSCDKYWLCVGGYPRLQRCPAGLAFAIGPNKCDLDYTVPGCEPTPPPVDSNDIDNEEEPSNAGNTSGNGSNRSTNRDSDIRRRA